MIKYKIIFEDDIEDEVFDTYAEADEYAHYLVALYHLGGEILGICNSEEDLYDLEEDPYDPENEPKYEIVECLRMLWKNE